MTAAAYFVLATCLRTNVSTYQPTYPPLGDHCCDGLHRGTLRGRPLFLPTSWRSRRVMACCGVLRRPWGVHFYAPPGAPKSVSGWFVACGLFSSVTVWECRPVSIMCNPSRTTPLAAQLRSIARLRLVRCGSLGFAKTVGNSDDVQTSSLVTSTLSCHVSLTSHTLYSSHSLYVYGFTESDFHATSIRDAPARSLVTCVGLSSHAINFTCTSRPP